MVAGEERQNEAKTPKTAPMVSARVRQALTNAGAPRSAGSVFSVVRVPYRSYSCVSIPEYLANPCFNCRLGRVSWLRSHRALSLPD